MTAKELLLQYENCRRKEKRLRSEILWTREEIRSLDLIPVKKTIQMKKDLLLIEKKLQTYEEDLVRISEERQKIHDLISDVPGLEGEILTRRYVNGEIWEDICESVFYSWSYVHRLHKRGLQIIQDQLDQEAFEGSNFDSLSTVKTTL